MSFAGGPWNNYPMHGIATMAGVLRDDPDALGLCTANGGYTTKHAFGVYGARPPAAGFRHDDLQAEVDALPRREEAGDYAGAVTVDSYTVMHDRAGRPGARAAWPCSRPTGPAGGARRPMPTPWPTCSPHQPSGGPPGSARTGPSSSRADQPTPLEVSSVDPPVI